MKSTVSSVARQSEASVANASTHRAAAAMNFRLLMVGGLAAVFLGVGRAADACTWVWTASSMIEFAESLSVMY